MVSINPVSIWSNGALKEATLLNLTCINDNLKDTATFYYQLMDTGQTGLANGNLTMDGKAYEDWIGNQYAYEWAAGQLNLTIVENTETNEEA